MGGLHKILVKVLANRVKKVVGKVACESQHALVERKHILDMVLTALILP